jgi:hypothetical protein
VARLRVRHAWELVKMPLLPHLTLWGSPLYNELYVGLCRALAGPWLCGVERSAVEPGEGRRFAAQNHWRLLDSRSVDGDPIAATSLAELQLALRDLRSPGHPGTGSGEASSDSEIGESWNSPVRGAGSSQNGISSSRSS